ncbi:hypothetical protein EIQ18_19525 [Xanthomonas campestris pv. campestris]
MRAVLAQPRNGRQPDAAGIHALAPGADEQRTPGSSIPATRDAHSLGPRLEWLPTWTAPAQFGSIPAATPIHSQPPTANRQPPIPNPQSPIPNPQSPIPNPRR